MAARKKVQLPRRLFKQPRVPATSGLAPPGAEVVHSPPGVEKMSEVLEDFIEPYRALATDEDAVRKLLMLAILAWNAALLPDDQRRAMVDETLGAGFPDPAAEADAQELVALLIRRKEELFASNRRMILNFELTDRGDDFHLSVMSSL